MPAGVPRSDDEDGRGAVDGRGSVDGRGAMIRRFAPADRDAVVRLIDASVGEGFLDASLLASGLCFVAEANGVPSGAVVTTMRDPAWGTSLPPALRAAVSYLPEPACRLLHIAELAVDPDARGQGLATRLVQAAEEAGRGDGAGAAVAVAWLPADPDRPTSEGVFRRRAFADLGVIADFYREISLAAGAHCPACGPPPCRCSVRLFLKDLRT
jgi:ribosomal protein S18 acetylase RimI-like enzyme